MRNVMLIALGAVGLYEAARRFGLISEEKIKEYVTNVWNDVHLNELLNVEKLKQMVGMQTERSVAATA